MPLNSVIVHIGTSIYAENLLNQYQYSTINGMYLGSTSFVFDEARSAAGYANEHCWYTDAALIAAGMEKLGLSGTAPARHCSILWLTMLNRWCLPKVTPQTWRSAFRIPVR